MNPELITTDSDGHWYTNSNEEYEVGNSSSLSCSQYREDLALHSSYSSTSSSPARQFERKKPHQEKLSRCRTQAAAVGAVNIGHGIYYYGDSVLSPPVRSPASKRGHHSTQNGRSDDRVFINGQREPQMLLSTGSDSHYSPQYSKSAITATPQINAILYSQPASRRVRISSQPDYSQVEHRAAPHAPLGISKSSQGVPFYSAFVFGSRSKKSKASRALKKDKSKSGKSGSKSSKSRSKASYGSSLHPGNKAAQVSSAVHPIPQKISRVQGYLSDCEGYRRAQKENHLQASSKHKESKWDQSGYCSDYGLVKQHREKRERERNAKGYSSGYETTGSFFSGSEWSEDEEDEIETSLDFLSSHRTTRTKSAGTLVFRKIAKKFSKMSVKGASGGDAGEEASDGSGGSTSWSAKKVARKKKLRSNSVSNLNCPDE